MNCLTFLVKYFLFIVNLAITVAALAIIATGSYALYYVNNNDVLAYFTMPEDALIVNNYVNAEILKFICIAVVVLGCVIFLISFCGCCGSIVENKCLLVSYATVMLVLAGGTIYVLITRSGYFDKAETWVEGQLQDIFYTPPHPIENEIINGIQYSVKCCGYNGPEFYNATTLSGDIDQHVLDVIYDKLNITGIGLVSPSCCSTINLEGFLNNTQNYLLNDFNCTADDVYRDGCLPKVLSFVEIGEKYFMYVFTSIAGVTVLAFLFGIYLCCSIKPKNRKYERY